MRDLSSSLRDARSQLAENDELRVFMDNLRGKNINDDDFAAAGQQVSLVSVSSDPSAEDQLPLVYDPQLIADYWDIRPVSVLSRITQLLSLSGGFLSRLAFDIATGQVKNNEVKRAIEIRDIVTSLGPAYIKLGQALSIRPDILSPAAMNELQKLCDKVPSYDNDVAMAVIEQELGMPWHQAYAELSPAPIAAASLGQVYKGKLKTGEDVAVKVQRPGVLETVTIDLYVIRKLGMILRRFPDIKTDVVDLLDEWAARFFEELDYVREGANATKFAEQMKYDLPQVVVPKTYTELTARRVLTTEWLEGEKLSQSKADDVGDLVNIGVICYLKQLLDTGFFHADPHPGNLIRTPDGRLAVLDFGLMTQVDDNIKFGMIEAISHLIHRDYEAIVEDFVTLQFIPKGTDLSPILPVLAKVFDQALEGGGAKNINFQELAADLAQITFDYPFRIPPYFALIIRAISVLEGIALVGNPEFAIVDEAYPYLAKRLLTDDTPRLREALKYMVYGKQGVFDADRLIDLLDAFETFSVNSKSANGDMDMLALPAPTASTPPPPAFPLPFPLPSPGSPATAAAPFGGLFPVPALLAAAADAAAGGPAAASAATQYRATAGGSAQTSRAALLFLLSDEGHFFRGFFMDEIVRSVDALSRDQLRQLVYRLQLENVLLPVLLPGSNKRFVPLAPEVDPEDVRQVESVAKLVDFLAGGSARGLLQLQGAGEILPLMPRLAGQLLPEITMRLVSRISARLVREFYL